jgi:hypothetical protein
MGIVLLRMEEPVINPAIIIKLPVWNKINSA